MARNFNSFNASSAEHNPADEIDLVNDPENFDNTASYEAEPTETDNPAEQNVHEATDRVSAMINEGAAVVEGIKDRYGESVSEFKESAKETYEDLKEKASQKLRGIGRTTAQFAKNAGLGAIGAGVMGFRASREKAINAKNNIAERIQERKAQRHQRELDAAHSEALKEDEQREYQERYESGKYAAQDMYEKVEDARTSERGFGDQELRNRTAAEQLQFSPESEGGYIDGWEAGKQAFMDKVHEEALAMNEQYDEQKEAERLHEIAREWAAYKAYRAQQRTELRRQAYDATVGRAGQWYTAAKNRAAQTGRSIAGFTKRTVSAARAARMAAQESWQGNAE